ncbi:hypothetical protein B0H13DRAFT_2358985 [Mycena leptocephala]|nr:hypothetical protein B0H13DRAFT_2358985 [Mycena leptocephala]
MHLYGNTVYVVSDRIFDARALLVPPRSRSESSAPRASENQFTGPVHLLAFLDVGPRDHRRRLYHQDPSSSRPHNNADGTGGTDVSIRFPEEQARAENAADGFNNILRLLAGVASRCVSIADALALGAITAIENWYAFSISHLARRPPNRIPRRPHRRSGPGVPQPQQDLKTNIGAFARQGFTQTEMIGLVACGAKEYISGTTQNPLVVGSNDTTNSDKRIFGSDGNATMHLCVFPFVLVGAVIPPSSFACSTQPKNIRHLPLSLRLHLLQIIRQDAQYGPERREAQGGHPALPVKPDNLELTLDGDELVFSGMVRARLPLYYISLTILYISLTNPFISLNKRTLIDPRTRSSSKNKNKNNATLTFSSVSTCVSSTAAWYSFDDPPIVVDAKAGIKGMRFVVDGKLHDQGGVGFAVQDTDTVMFSETSCLTDPDASPVRNGANVTASSSNKRLKTASGVSPSWRRTFRASFSSFSSLNFSVERHEHHVRLHDMEHEYDFCEWRQATIGA